MSFGEKGNWLYLVVTAVTFAVYVVIVLGRAGDASLPEVRYESTMLWAIGFTVGLNVLGSIAIAIAKPSEADTTDERDKTIDRFGDYVGGIVLGIGMLGPLGLALADADSFWIANTIFTVFVLSILVSSIVKIFGYRLGLSP